MPRVHHLPAFPSTAQVYRGGGPGVGTQVYNGPAEKVVWPRGGIMSVIGFALGGGNPPLCAVYFPAGTDVRGVLSSSGEDVIQWQGNANWLYTVLHVDDVADGFTNKFRVAWCLPTSQPTPLP